MADDSNKEISAERSLLVLAVGPVRLTEGRLTGGFRYARFETRAEESKNLTSARYRIERKLRKKPSPRALADLGVLRLIDGRPKDAVKLLKRAAERANSDPQIWSDLSAAYLASAKGEPYSPDLFAALEAADRAITLNPTMQEAHFNLGVIQSKLLLKGRARETWSRLLSSEDQTDWDKEARERFFEIIKPEPVELWENRLEQFERSQSDELTSLARDLVNLSPQQAREFVEEVLLGRWAEARSQNKQTSSVKTLVQARSLGVVLAANGDSMAMDASSSISNVSPNSIDGLTKGHVLYQRGLVLYSSGSFNSALPLFSSAAVQLQAAGTPFELWARFRLAVCQKQLYQYESALLTLSALLADERISRYPALKARTFWVAGLVFGIRGDMIEALAHYSRARDLFSRLDEPGNIALVSNLLAEAYRELGDLAAAWRFHLMALEGVPWIAVPARRQPILEELGVSLLRSDKPQIALYFMEELLRSYSASMLPAAQIGALRRMAEAQYQDRNPGAAIRFVRQAEAISSGVIEERLRGPLRADLLAVEGQAEAERNPDRAIGLLSGAIREYWNTDYHQQLVKLFLRLAQAYSRKLRYQQAESSLQAALDLISDQRPSSEISTVFLGDLRQVYDEMINIQTLQGRPEIALSYAEKAREQMLYLSGSSLGRSDKYNVLSPEEFQELLPPGTAIVEFWKLRSKLLVWVIRREGVSFSMISDSESSEGLVKRVRDLILEDNLESSKYIGSHLFNHLLLPLWPMLKDASNLVFVPDKFIYRVPFSALSVEGKFLVENYRLSIAPTASMYVHCLLRAKEFPVNRNGVLALGNPAFDRGLFPGLAPLRRAEAEAQRIQSLYPMGKMLLGARVSRREVERELPRWSIIHFGGHAVANSVNPLRSSLLLSRAGKDSGVLYLSDLSRTQLKRVRLVFLAACSSLGNSPEGEAIVASPLLVWGVPSVVGTLWTVKDQAAGDFAVEFHRRFASKGDVAGALRDTQLSFLHSSRPEMRRISHWASFEVMGY